MAIVVNNVVPANHPHAQEIFQYCQEFIIALAVAKPQQCFILLQEVPPQKTMPENVTIQLFPKPNKNRFYYYWWQQVQLPQYLKKQPTIQWLLQPYGYCSFTTKLPQQIILTALPSNSSTSTTSLIDRYWLAASIKKATRAVTFSPAIAHHFSKTTLHQPVFLTHPVNKKMVNPLSWEEKQPIKEKFSEGYEYYLYIGSILSTEHVVECLKSFSEFKKWQKSNMKFLIYPTEWNEVAICNLTEKISSYKYKNDVAILENDAASIQQIVAAAYGVLLPNHHYPFLNFHIQALQLGVPVIAFEQSGWSDYFDGHLLLINESHQTLGKTLIQLYKEEWTRKAYSEKGMQFIAEKIIPDAIEDLKLF